MAKNLSYAARGAGISRVAVVPFSSVDGQPGDDGRVISESLITRMVRLGRVTVVERSLLRKLMSEDLLDQTGAVAPSSAEKMGKMLSADGIVTGTYDDTGDGVLVNARLIDVETGVILAAAQREIDEKMFGDSSNAGFGGQGGTIWVPAPAFPPDRQDDMRDALAEAPSPETAPPPADPASLPGMADASGSQAGNSCAGASARVDQMETRILEIKARYWAKRLRDGLSTESLKINSGSMISDPALKKSFYGRLEYWYHQDRIPNLSPDEARRLVALDGAAYSLYSSCGTRLASAQ
ncbi:MAG TPA: FlgO family outer membrane protein [Elusimicrobiota bacterium]|nr:FlgO family outer membrane protein [Elusimicrobiota bacterium]